MIAFENMANKRDQKSESKQPVWFDKNDSKVTVDIEHKSRLRKLKASEEETEVKGDEYSKRLQETYIKMQGQHSMFEWAKQTPHEESDPEDSDPIGDLLKSNTSVFGHKNTVLKQNHLDFKKLKNANTGHYHQ